MCKNDDVFCQKIVNFTIFITICVKKIVEKGRIMGLLNFDGEKVHQIKTIFCEKKCVNFYKKFCERKNGL